MCSESLVQFVMRLPTEPRNFKVAEKHNNTSVLLSWSLPKKTGTLSELTYNIFALDSNGTHLYTVAANVTGLNYTVQT